VVGLRRGSIGGMRMRWHKIQGLYEGFMNLFEEIAISQEFIGIMDDVNEALIIAEIYKQA
jgi:hypothetical protein